MGITTTSAKSLYEEVNGYNVKIKKLNSVTWVRKRTVPTERPPIVGEVSANFLRVEDATWSALRIPTFVISAFQTGTATFSFK
jgi:hypothetical protein